MNLLKNKIALVTGSSRGIGAAIARLFAQQGAKVAVHGRDTAALCAVQADIESDGGTAMQVFGDVTRFTEIEAMRRQIEEKIGPVDILVANAGGSFTMPGPLEQTSEEGWHASIDGNLTATFLMLPAALSWSEVFGRAAKPPPDPGRNPLTTLLSLTLSFRPCGSNFYETRVSRRSPPLRKARSGAGIHRTRPALRFAHVCWKFFASFALLAPICWISVVKKS